MKRSPLARRTPLKRGGWIKRKATTKKRSGGIYRGPLDALFSDYIRMRDRWKCVRCDTYFPPGKGRMGLHSAHLLKVRRGKSTRWLEQNCAGTCYGCHQHLAENPDKAVRWFIERYGQQQYDYVQAQANLKIRSWELEVYKMAKRVWLVSEMWRLHGLGYEPPTKKEAKEGGPPCLIAAGGLPERA